MQGELVWEVGDYPPIHAKKGDVVIIRFEGPKGGPGMQEMLAVTGAIMGAGLGETTTLITDGHGIDGNNAIAGP